jgi:hypothetical protein
MMPILSGSVCCQHSPVSVDHQVGVHKRVGSIPATTQTIQLHFPAAAAAAAASYTLRHTAAAAASYTLRHTAAAVALDAAALY